jgi:hypothetical protein
LWVRRILLARAVWNNMINCGYIIHVI